MHELKMILMVLLIGKEIFTALGVVGVEIR